MENEVRLIDANAFIETIEKIASEDKIPFFHLDEITQEIFDAPTIDPESLRPKGRWENYPSHMHRRCSICKVEWEKPRFNIRANYCPNCGADMRGEDDARKD